ncbi:MAG: M56 family metallopeptidase [Opitutaceae bacterium]
MACLVLVFLALRPLLRGRVSARVLFWVWVAVAIRLLIPFAVPINWSPFNLVRFAKSEAAAGKIRIPPTEPMRHAVKVPASTPPTPVAFAEIRPGRLARLSPVQWAASAWILGAALLLICRIRAHRRFVRRLSQLHSPADSAQEVLLAEAAAELGVHGIRVIVTDAVGAPALHGLFRPMLLFPPGLLDKLGPCEFRMIVAHELGHCQRRDLQAQAVIRSAQILHWFNPLIWVAARTARHDCELACDEHVVRSLSPAEPQVYGAALLKIAGIARAPQVPLGLGIVETKQQIKRRIQMIIAKRPSSFSRAVFGCAVLVLVATLCLTRETQAQQQPAAPGSMVTTEPPGGWRKNGSNLAAYVVGLDRSQTHEGKPSAYVKSIQPVAEGFGGMMQICSAENFVGKRLRFSAWMKTENADIGGGHLWLRVDGKENGQVLQFDNMDGRTVRGTTDWAQYSVVLDVPANAADLAYGFFVDRTGKVWVSGAKIEEVGEDVPSTNILGNRSAGLPKLPFNLDFSGPDQSDAPRQSPAGAASNITPSQSDNVGENESVTIMIESDGTIKFNGKPVTDESLEKVLGNVRMTNGNIPVLIKCTESSQVKRLAFVWDICRKTGFNNMRIQTR